MMHPMRPLLSILLIFGSTIMVNLDTALANPSERLRPPAYPIVAHNPYYSLWSSTDDLTESEVHHWTEVPMPLRSMLRVDGQAYRLMGAVPAQIPAATQLGVEVTATRTIYSFEVDHLLVTLTFLTPCLPADMILVSRPITYVTWEIESMNGQERAIELYFEASAHIAADSRRQMVEWDYPAAEGLEVVKVGTVDQPILGKAGDDVRIDWGYLHLAVDSSSGGRVWSGSSQQALPEFAETGALPPMDPSYTQDRLRDGQTALAARFAGTVSTGKPFNRWVMLGYDERYAVELFNERLLPYWRTEAKDFLELLQSAGNEFEAIRRRCIDFDHTFYAEAKMVGGWRYAKLCALVFRQCMAAHIVVVDQKGRPLCFSKENASNGSMGTVDVFYPASPFFLHQNPELMKAQTTPIFEYAAMERWPWPYAPHDIGKYPLANGQTYGGGEVSEDRQMPIEESGNMVLMAAAISAVEGNTDYADTYWDLITQWADYLVEKGYDPENQLCTDDFAGHLASNANLSLKAIMAVGAYGKMCAMRGEAKRAAVYSKEAQSMMAQWLEAADNGTHYRLAFDQEDTWSLKYNLVWDPLLNLGLGTEAILKKELAFYKTVTQPYGLPLDNRMPYAKLDWILWMAGILEDPVEFDALFLPVYRFVDETPNRMPLTDWYWTPTGQGHIFKARSVVGGVLMRMLYFKMKRQGSVQVFR